MNTYEGLMHATMGVARKLSDPVPEIMKQAVVARKAGEVRVQ
jgi:hypothetical protein